MPNPAALLRGCEILQHVTARFSTIGYVTQHVKGTRSQEIILLTFPLPHAPFKPPAGANPSSLETSVSSEGFRPERSQPAITKPTVFLFSEGFFFFFFFKW